MYLKNVYHHCLCCIFDQVTMPVKQKFCKSLGATLHFALLVSGWGDQEVDSFPPPPLCPPPDPYYHETVCYMLTSNSEVQVCVQ